MISVDAGKKELVGAYANKGRCWRPEGQPSWSLIARPLSLSGIPGDGRVGGPADAASPSGAALGEARVHARRVADEVPESCGPAPSG